MLRIVHLGKGNLRPGRIPFYEQVVTRTTLGRLDRNDNNVRRAKRERKVVPMIAGGRSHRKAVITRPDVPFQVGTVEIEMDRAIKPSGKQ